MVTSDLYDADGIKSTVPDKSVHTSSGCEDASSRPKGDATLKDAMSLGYPPNEAIAWVCGYNVARGELLQAATAEHGGEQVVRGWLDDDGNLHPDEQGISYRRAFGPWQEAEQ